MEGDLARLDYLLDELRRWREAGLIRPEQWALLAPPYLAEADATRAFLHSNVANNAQPAPPACHAANLVPTSTFVYCPDCGVHLADWFRQQAEVVAASPAPPTAQPAPALSIAELAPPPSYEAGAEALGAATAADAAAAPVAEAATAQEPPAAVEKAEQRTAAPAVRPVATAATSRILKELRPAFFENLLLLTGGFLVFAGSLYFAVYFWDRLGAFGPLVAGTLLGAYGLAFAGAGYALQRRYHSDLNARVLYGLTTAILPVAVAVAGEPLGHGGTGTVLLAILAISGLCAAAYPILFVAASLFQREIGRSFARSFALLLLATGMAPLVARVAPRAIDVAYLYLTAMALLPMYRRVRGVGRIFERETVVYLVGGSAYALLAVGIRTALSVTPTLTAAELSPLLVILATAAVDLDAELRGRAFAVRSDLGVVGVLALTAAVLAVVISFPSAGWRVVTLLAAGLLFAVSALRHRQPIPLHFAAFIVGIGLASVLWVPPLSPATSLLWCGLPLLPASLGLALLGARWRRNAAVDFAAPCEAWTLLYVAVAATLAAAPRFPFVLPADVFDWSRCTGLSALVILPMGAVALAIAWHFGRRRLYLGVSAVLGGAAVLAALQSAGAGAAGLACGAAGSALGVMILALLARDAKMAARQALTDGAIVLAIAGVAFSAVGPVGPWRNASAVTGALTFLCIGCAALACFASRPRHELGLLAVLALSTAGCAALWNLPFLPRTCLPGLLALGLLALDRVEHRLALRGGRPFCDAYPVAVAAVGIQALFFLSPLFSIEIAPAPAPAQPVLLAISLLAIASRQKSRWPTHLAIGVLLVAAYGAPALLGLRVTPLALLKIVAAVMAFSCLALRSWPRLAAWRSMFLEPILDQAAIAGPAIAGLVVWEQATAWAGGAVRVRHVLDLIVLSLLTVLTHASLAHVYLVVGGCLLAGPIIARAAGLPVAIAAPMLAAGALVAAIATRAIATSALGQRAIRPGAAGKMRLFGRYPLSSAQTIGEMWCRPLDRLAVLAALYGLATGTVASVSAWPDGSYHAAIAFALLAAYGLFSTWTAGRPQRASAFAHAFCLSLTLLAIESIHLAGARPRSVLLVALGIGFYVLGDGLSRWRRSRTAAFARAASQWAVLLLLLSLVAWILGPIDLGWPLDPGPLAFAALLSALLLRPYAHLQSVDATVILGTAAGFLLWIDVRWSSTGVLVAANACAGTGAVAAWLRRPLDRWAGRPLPDVAGRFRWWGRLFTRGLALFALAVSLCRLFAPNLLGAPAFAGWIALGLAFTAAHPLLVRRRHRDWILLAVATATLACWYYQPGDATSAVPLAGTAAAWQLFTWLARRKRWFDDEVRERIDRVSFGTSIALCTAALILGTNASTLAWGGTLFLLAICLASWGTDAVRTGSSFPAYVAEVGLIGIYCSARFRPEIGLGPEADVIFVVGFALLLHFAAELIDRQQAEALRGPAVVGSRLLPLVACGLVAWNALFGDAVVATPADVALAETVGVLYTLGFRRGGHRLLALAATFFYNLGLALLWIHSDRRDPLFYTIPAGASLVVLAHVYKANLDAKARRGLRAFGALLVYLSGYYQVVQFQSGLYPVILGGVSLVGLAVGFYLQLRDLCLVSAAFLILDVVSNLVYVGLQSPVLGWTLVTLAGIGLTGSGILFQLRRERIRTFFGRARIRLAEWD